MKTEKMLQELETLTHSQRMKRMVEIGQSARENATLRALLQQLEAGDCYQRRLALQACYGSREGAPVTRLINDTSRLVRGLALHLAPLVLGDEELLHLLQNSRERVRRVLLIKVAKQRRVAVIDNYLRQLAETEISALAPLLTYASATAAEQLWPLVQESAAAHDWYRFAHYHPPLALRFLTKEIEALQDLPASAVYRCNSVLQVLAEVAPRSALQLLQILSARTPLKNIAWTPLALRLPRETADWLLQQDEKLQGGAGAFSNRARFLDEAQIEALLDKYPEVLGDAARWLSDLKPALRATVYHMIGRSWQSKNGVILSAYIAELPREIREYEGRRHWNLPYLSTRPLERLPYAAFLPWEEAREVVAPFLQNPDADLRRAAHLALSGAVRYQRAQLGELLELIQQRGNEQDPVRGAMLSGLAGLPPGIWKSEHLEMLGAIIQQALDAADLSATTSHCAEKLVVDILPFHTNWAAPWLTALVKARGHIDLSNLETRLSDADVQRLAPILKPVFEAWQVRERENQFIQAVRALGKRARVFSGLEKMLEKTAREGQAYIAAAALDILHQHFGAYFNDLVPRLLSKDKSYATQPVVYNFLHCKRQDLLNDFLGREAYKGKFSTGRTRFVLPMQHGFERWTPTQQQTFALTLSEIVSDHERDTPTVISVLWQMAALPDAPPPALWRVARRQSTKNLAARDTALRALARLDAGQGVEELIAALDDDRARIAIYALRAVLLEMPTARALEILRAAPTNKVTVGKEIVRLLGDLKEAEALDDLLQWATRDLHRDVHIALLRALWEHLEDARVWPILASAAQAPDAAISTMAARTTAPRLSAEAQKNLAQMLAQLARHPEAMVRLSVLQRCIINPVQDSEMVLRDSIFAALQAEAPDEYQAAARAIFQLYPRDSETIAEAISQLMPRRRALHDVLTQFSNEVAHNARLREAGRAVLVRLAADALCAPWRARLAVRVLNAQELRDLLGEFMQQNLLHYETLHALCDEIAPAAAANNVAWWSDAFQNVTHLRAPEKLETILKGNQDERLRRVALSCLVAAARDKRGWTAERCERLAQFQNDAAPLVSGAAQFTFAPEGETTVGETNVE